MIDRDKFVNSARQAQSGVRRDQLVPGTFVTLSPNLVTGDRSYSNEVYGVIAKNDGQVMIKQVTGTISEWFKGPHLICIHEHHFYLADHLMQAMKDA